jgi:HEPN domain-containing protein
VCRPAGPAGPPSHYPIEEAIRAQFGASLRAFGGLRRRRNELEYPLYPTERASAAEAAEALKTADEIIDAVTRLLPNLGFF